MFAPEAQTPRPPGTGGKRQPCGAMGSASPVGCCHRGWQSDPKRGSDTIRTTVREARMIEQPGHLGPKGAKRPEGAPEGSVCPVGTWAEGPKRPKGVSKYKGCARPARRTPIFARERNERWARSASSAKIERPGKAGRYEFTLEGTEGSASPVGCCHRRWQSDPKESTETSGGRGQRPPRRLRLRNRGPSKPPKWVASVLCPEYPQAWRPSMAAPIMPASAPRRAISTRE